MPKTTRLLREDVYLLIIVILAISSIFLHACCTVHGGISDDSARYLGLASQLLEYGSLSLPSVELSGTTQQYFSTWPRGYPLLIAAIAGAIGISVFTASKVLAALCIVALGLSFRQVFGRRAYIGACLLLFASYLKIFAFSWSEGPFIVLLFWFALGICRVIEERGRDGTNALMLLLLSLSLFLVRYIGAFSIGIIGLLACYLLWRGQPRRAAPLLGISVAAAALMGLYLLNNHMHAGGLTGTTRIPAPETLTQQLRDIGTALFAELTVTHEHFHLRSWVPLILQLLMGAYLFRLAAIDAAQPQQLKARAHYSLSRVLAVIGLLYCVGMIGARWLVQFDPVDYRLLGPASFLIWLALVSSVINSGKPRLIKAFSKALAALALVSCVDRLQSAQFTATSKDSYPAHMISIERQYSSVPAGSIVVFAPREIYFLRADLIPAIPYFWPYYPQRETWPDFLRRVGAFGRPVFVDVPEAIDEKFDTTVLTTVSQWPSATLVKLEP
jgi:hypothetical protein